MMLFPMLGLILLLAYLKVFIYILSMPNSPSPSSLPWVQMKGDDVPLQARWKGINLMLPVSFECYEGNVEDVRFWTATYRISEFACLCCKCHVGVTKSWNSFRNLIYFHCICCLITLYISFWLQ